MNTVTPTDGLRPGFFDPSIQSQRVFRGVLDAMARPGILVDLAVELAPPAPLDPATAAVALTLADYETPLWLDCGDGAAAQYLRFHCGCPMTAETGAGAFAIITAPAAMPPLSAFRAGCDEYPDRSATLIVQVPSLTAGPVWRLSGPGILGGIGLAVAGLPPAFRQWAEDNHALFPRGVDLIFTSGAALVALPRSTRLEGTSCMSR